MTILNLVVYPDERLRHTTKMVEKFDGELKKLTADMLESMYHHKGVGLAAPQIGKALRVFVVDVSDGRNEPMVFINPQILSKSGSNEYEEGCLSVPDYTAKVVRPKIVSVRAQDINGQEFSLNADELLATCIQHEFDHLEGKLFIDHISKLKRQRYETKLAKMAKNDV